MSFCGELCHFRTCGASYQSRTIAQHPGEEAGWQSLPMAPLGRGSGKAVPARRPPSDRGRTRRFVAQLIGTEKSDRGVSRLDADFFGNRNALRTGTYTMQMFRYPFRHR